MIGRLFLRVLLIAAVSLGFALVGGCHWIWLRVRRMPLALRQGMLGRYLASYCRMLGATFVKAGQILSTRPDLASDALRRPLSVLHDRVGPFPFAEVRRALAADFDQPPEELFEELDPYPVASASVAQVHRGRLRDGRLVAVKVLRPKVRPLVRCDLWLMGKLARIVAWIPSLRALDPVAAIRSFSDAIWQQLDLRIEAKNNREFAGNFAATDDILVPDLVDELCSETVMTMDFIEGEKILSEDWEEPEHLVRSGFRMVLQMIFVDGFIHADLHPGNMFVVEGQKLVLLDLGLVARLSDRHRKGLTQLLLAWGSRNVSEICEGIGQVAFFGQQPKDLTRLQQDVELMLERYRDVTLEHMEVGRLLQDIIQLVRSQWAHLDPAMAMMALGIGVVEGVAKQLAPHMRLVDEALPYLQTHLNN